MKKSESKKKEIAKKMQKGKGSLNRAGGKNMGEKNYLGKNEHNRA